MPNHKDQEAIGATLLEFDDLTWTREQPTRRGLYWRRNNKTEKPYLAVVSEGPRGLVERIVEEVIG